MLKKSGLFFKSPVATASLTSKLGPLIRYVYGQLMPRGRCAIVVL